MRQSAPDSAGPSSHATVGLKAAPICLPAFGIPAGDTPSEPAQPAGRTAALGPAALLFQLAAPRPATHLPPAHHPLEPLAARAAWLLKGCEVSLIPGVDGPAMLMIERLSADRATATHTWLLTPVSATALELECVVGETRLDLVAEGPPDRLLACLWRLNLRAARAETRKAG